MLLSVLTSETKRMFAALAFPALPAMATANAATMKVCVLLVPVIFTLHTVSFTGRG